MYFLRPAHGVQREGQRVFEITQIHEALGRDERTARGGLAELRGAARVAAVDEDGQHRSLGKQGDCV